METFSLIDRGCGRKPWDKLDNSLEVVMTGKQFRAFTWLTGCKFRKLSNWAGSRKLTGFWNVIVITKKTPNLTTSFIAAKDLSERMAQRVSWRTELLLRNKLSACNVPQRWELSVLKGFHFIRTHDLHSKWSFITWKLMSLYRPTMKATMVRWKEQPHPYIITHTRRSRMVVELCIWSQVSIRLLRLQAPHFTHLVRPYRL